MNNEPTNNDAIDAISLASPDMGNRLAIWYSLGDPKALLEELQGKAIQHRFMGTPLSMTDQFVYGCLRLASPELFASGFELGGDDEISG